MNVGGLEAPLPYAAAASIATTTVPAGPGLPLAAVATVSAPASTKDFTVAATATPNYRVSSPTPAARPPFSPTATPTPYLSPTPACLNAGGSFENGRLATELLRAPLEYRIYLPPCYQEQPNRRYPVLYLFHGLLSNADQWDRIGVDEAADKGIAAGEIPPLIIVMPYDPYTTRPPANKYDLAVVEQLVPYIDRTYRTIPDRAHRGVGGLSRGGGWAVHLAMVYWDVFGVLGGHSPAIFFSDYERMPGLINAIPSDAYPRIYLDIGDRDQPEAVSVVEGYEEMLDEMDVPHEWHLFSGYHAEAYWAAHVKQYLLWYTYGW